MILFNGIAYRKYLDSFSFLMRMMAQQNWTVDIGERLRVWIRCVPCVFKVLSLYLVFLCGSCYIVIVKLPWNSKVSVHESSMYFESFFLLALYIIF